VKLEVNGSPRVLADGATIADLLRELGVDARAGVAVAVDRAVVPRGEHDRRALAEGQKIEVIRAVGGG
jgi:thiamine biosynthesis protein ThiS